MNAMTLARLLSYRDELRPDHIPADIRLSAVDWQEILRQSLRHGVAPLLCYRLKHANAGSVLPMEIWGKLQTLYWRSAAVNASLYRNLAEALQVLRKNGIAVIILKGGYLAQHVYDNMALRPMSDFDLLVKKADLKRARGLFLELGYHDSGADELHSNSYHLPPLVKNGAAPVGIELHWEIEKKAAGFAIDTDGLWRRAQPAAIAGAETLALGPEDLLLHLCLHASYHHQFRFGLRALCDVAETIRRFRRQLDWEQLQTRASQWGTAKCVYMTLRLAAELLEARVPAIVLQNLQPQKLTQNFLTTSRAFTLGELGDSFYLQKFVSLWTSRRWRDKLNIAKSNALPARETLARLYPASPSRGRFNFYYVKRWQDLLRRYRPIVWQLLRGKKQMQALIAEEEKRQALKKWLREA